MAPLRRLSWGVLDQGVSSVTNFALAAVVAREASPREFGAFTIGFIAYTMVMGLSRAVSMEPLLMRFGNSSHAEWSRATREATGASLVLAVVAAFLAALIALAVDGYFREVFFALALSLPGLILQDAWRFAFFSAGRGQSAFLNDVVWAAALVPLLAVTLIRSPDIGTLTLAWGGAATIAATVGSWQARLLPLPRAALRWERENRHIGSRILGEFVAMTATAHLTLYGIGVVAGITALGAIRGAQILLGPFNVVIIGIGLVAIPEGMRLLTHSAERLRTAAMWLSVSLAACALALGALLTALPSRAGGEVLGATWPNASEVIFPIAICIGFWGVTTGAMLGLRVLGNFDKSLRARLLSSVISLSGGIGGAAAGGATGAAWGWALGLAVGSSIWWMEFTGAIRKRQADSGAVAPATASAP